MAMKSFSEVDSDDVAVDRVFAHHFTDGAPVPQTLALGCAVCVPLFVPFQDVSTDMELRTNNPHPAGFAGLGPPAFMDADHGIILGSARVEIFFVDPHPFNVDGASTLETSATCAFLL